jgi:hypothetical protein
MSEPAKFVIFGLIIVVLAVLALCGFRPRPTLGMSIIESEQSERADLGQYPCFH